MAFDPKRFDNTPKTILGKTDNFNLDSFCSLIAAQPATATRICTKLFTWFVGDHPSSSDLDPLTKEWQRTGGEIRSVLRVLFNSDAFTAALATTAHIKNPAAWMIGLLRGLGLTAQGSQIADAIDSQGMSLFEPPTVGGWPSGPAWISPDDQLLRYNIAGQFIATATTFTGLVTGRFLHDLADTLGGIVIAADVQSKLLTFGNGSDGARRRASRACRIGLSSLVALTALERSIRDG